MSRSITLFLALAVAIGARAQATGISMGVDYVQRVVDGAGVLDAGSYGLGLHKDFDRRIGAALEGRYMYSRDAVYGWEVLYSARYFMADNTYTAGFLGSYIGYRTVGLDGGSSGPRATIIPIGLCAGVRGGLAGYFAALQGYVGYGIGGGAALSESRVDPLVTSRLHLAIGVIFGGFGWDN